MDESLIEITLWDGQLILLFDCRYYFNWCSVQVVVVAVVVNDDGTVFMEAVYSTCFDVGDNSQCDDIKGIGMPTERTRSRRRNSIKKKKESN